MDLSCVTQTEYYAGLFKSSPKVTLHVASETPLSGQGAQDAAQDAHDASESWECQVCSYRNPPGLSPAAARICALCGVPRSAVPSQATTHLTPPHHQHLSSSLPSTPIPSGPSPTLPSDEPGAMGPDSSISCPACTFLNHPSLHACEMCGSSLPRRSARTAARSAPTSRPASPDVSEDEDDEPRAMFIKLSFRKGGDKAFYAVLKRSLKAKGWEVVTSLVYAAVFLNALLVYQASGVMNHSIPTRPPAAAGDDPANNSLSISRSGIREYISRTKRSTKETHPVHHFPKTASYKA
jgi:ESCRT-II complex subunit VPS36